MTGIEGLILREHSWNSTVFTKSQSNSYYLFVVSSDFETSTFSCQDVAGQNLCGSAASLLDQLGIGGQLERLSTADCMKLYSTDLLVGRRHLVLVSNITKHQMISEQPLIEGTVFGSTTSAPWEGTIGANGGWNPSGWFCSKLPYGLLRASDEWLDRIGVYSNTSSSLICPLSQAIAEAEFLQIQIPLQKTVVGIDRCLSEVVPEMCEVNFSYLLMGVVIFFNFVMITCMGTALACLRHEPLLVIGDAVASFLNNPDPTTRGVCLLEASDDLRALKEPKVWVVARRRWYNATNKMLLVVCFTTYESELSLLSYS